MKPKKVRESKTEMGQLMMPNDANHAGFVHGGVILSIADKVAYVCASRHAESLCVTMSVDQVLFKKPIRVGELVQFKASVNYVGKTSVEVGIKIFAEDLLHGTVRHTNSCYFTMVATDEKGHKKRVPELILDSDEERRRNAEAKERREFSLSRN